MKLYYERDGIEIWHGDCRNVAARLLVNDHKFSTIVTDPPYGLEFMGKDWDHGTPGVHFWKTLALIVHPAGTLLAFGGTRTYHRLACAMEDGGWEIRDCLSWLYGSGFPKSYDISKGVDKAAGVEREKLGVYAERAVNKSLHGRADPDDPEYDGTTAGVGKRYITKPATSNAEIWDGYGTALKPAWEPILLSMKPRDGTFVNNALEHGVAGLNVDGGRVGTEQLTYKSRGMKNLTDQHSMSDRLYAAGLPNRDEPVTQVQGRWPANVILDEEAGEILGRQSGTSKTPSSVTRGGKRKQEFGMARQNNVPCYGDTGTAARFFYTAKSSKSERNLGCESLCWERDKDSPIGFKIIDQERWESLPPRQRAQGNIHPTVKPVKLLEYLCTLTKMPTDADYVLDPFLGSGSTLIACARTGRRGVGIELYEEYCEIAARRVDAALDKLESGL